MLQAISATGRPKSIGSDLAGLEFGVNKKCDLKHYYTSRHGKNTTSIAHRGMESWLFLPGPLSRRQHLFTGLR
jgi:hypothetical protein